MGGGPRCGERPVALCPDVALGRAPGGCVLAPCGAGGAVAASRAVAGVALAMEWLAFVGISVLAFLALRPLAKRLDRAEGYEGIGSRRLIGRPAIVVEPISDHSPGLVRVDSEEWRAGTAARSPPARG